MTPFGTPLSPQPPPNLRRPLPAPVHPGQAAAGAAPSPGPRIYYTGAAALPLGTFAQGLHHLKCNLVNTDQHAPSYIRAGALSPTHPFMGGDPLW